jgi:hypothetical protein
VVITERLGTYKTRLIYTVRGFGSDVGWAIHNNSPVNALRALVERVYMVNSPEGLVPTPKPHPQAFRRLDEFRTRLLRHIPRAAPIDREQYPSNYVGRLKAVYQRAVDSLRSEPVRRDDARIKPFVKAEKINVSKKPDPCPRLIQPRSPRYNVEVGVYLKPLERLVYRAIAKVWGGQTVLKLNAEEQAKELRSMWDSFSDPVAVGLDASRFDQHVSADALRWEHSCYLAAFKGEDRHRLGCLLEWQINNRATMRVGDAEVRYVTDGCRMSGDINTSLGNCLLMSAMVWTYCHEKGIRARLANNGDDCVVIMDGQDLLEFEDGLIEWFLELGFEMEVERPVKTFEHIQFCQTQPVWAGDRWLMCRQPDVAISKDLTSLLPLDKCLKAYLGAIGQCGLRALGGMPVFQEFYANLALAGKGSGLGDHPTLASGLRMMADRLQRGYGEISAETRASFCFAFGILPSEQIQLEEWLRANPLNPHLPLSPTPITPRWYN